VEAAGLLLDTLEQRAHLLVVAMIADDGDAAPAAFGGVLGSGEHCPAEWIVAGLAAAPRDVDGRARRSQRDRDSFADSEACSGNERNAIFQHVKLLRDGARRYSRRSSPGPASSPRRDSSDPSRPPTCCRWRRVPESAGRRRAARARTRR